MVQSFWKTVWQFLMMSNIWLLHDSAIPFLGIYTRELKTISSAQNFYVNVHSSIIHNSQKVRTTQTLINWWKSKQNMAYLHHGMFFCSKRGHILVLATSWKKKKNKKIHVKWKKSIMSGHILYESINMKYWETTNTWWL